jgi:hypothetical protein
LLIVSIGFLTFIFLLVPVLPQQAWSNQMVGVPEVESPKGWIPEGMADPKLPKTIQVQDQEENAIGEVQRVKRE